MTDVFLIVLGGFFGAIARFTISGLAKQYFPSLFPYGTLFINLGGSFLLGFLLGADTGIEMKLLMGIGFMGSFTTFSTFKVELITLFEQQHWKVGVLYLSVSYIGGIIFAYFGYQLAFT